jgi:prepilin-type N-terminal cleavage/methylation domain-containing protein
MARTAGFSLLELLVVVGVISVLSGLALGFLGRTDPQKVADAILAAELRSAQLSARADGVPSEVLLLPGAPGEPSTVSARLLQPVVAFHLEPGEPVLDETMRPVLGGEDVPGGRFGHARRTRDGERAPLLRWPTPPGTIDLRDGFVVRLDLCLASRASGTVLQCLPAVEVTLDAGAVPRARLRLRSGGGSGTTLAAVAADVGLPVGRWCTLEIGCDGQEAWLGVDGREIARAIAEGVPQQELGSVCIVGPGDGGFVGMVDEIRWFVFAWSPPQKLPPELQFERRYRFLFDARGEPVQAPTVRYVGQEGS